MKTRPFRTHSVSCFSNLWSHSVGDFLRKFVGLPLAVTDFLGKGSFFKELEVQSQKRGEKTEGKETPPFLCQPCVHTRAVYQRNKVLEMFHRVHLPHTLTRILSSS